MKMKAGIGVIRLLVKECTKDGRQTPRSGGGGKDTEQILPSYTGRASPEASLILDF